jgi:hypothetical protein
LVKVWLVVYSYLNSEIIVAMNSNVSTLKK